MANRLRVDCYSRITNGITLCEIFNVKFPVRRGNPDDGDFLEKISSVVVVITVLRVIGVCKKLSIEQRYRIAISRNEFSRRKFSLRISKTVIKVTSTSNS